MNRRYLPLCLILAAALPWTASAQPAEQINVTGAGANRDATSTTLLDSAAIARSGAASLGTLLDELPAFGAQGVNNAQAGGGLGEYFVDLRNLNFNRTLVLVDGQRFVLSGIKTDEAVDLNLFPASFVDHIEVLRDGTQPQYAADAVAGAVNLVLKDQVEGVHLDAYGAAAGAGDSGTADISLIAGHGFAGGHISVGLDAYHRDPVLQSDRAWSATPISAALATPGGPRIVYGSPATPGGHAIGDGINSLALGGGATRPYDPSTDYYNPSGATYLQGGLRRLTAYADADYALTDTITANAELLYTDRSATTLQPPQTLGLSATAKHPAGFVIPATDPFNPFGAPVSLERIVAEAGNQATTISGPVWRVLAGLDGMRGAWSWSLGVNHGQSLSRYVTENQINLTRALQTAGNGVCPANDGCVQADWFGPFSLSPRAVAYISATSRAQSAYGETVAQARIAGPLIGLPGGDARLILGGEIRRETGSTTVDQITLRGDQAGEDAAPTAGAYSTYEAYASLALPLLRGVRLADRLDLSLAARATATSRYGSFGTFRAAIDYTPLPGLHLRAITGTARRPPAISEAFGGTTANLQPVSDPCDAATGLRANRVVDANCRAQGLAPDFHQQSALINVASGGNPSLHPEQSENETIGLTLHPPAWPFLTASADYYHYRITDAIDSLADTDPNLIPDTCYTSDHLSSPLCGLITRITGGGNGGQISRILALDENVGTIKTDGLEFALGLDLPANKFGHLHLDWQTTWLLDYRLRTIGQSGFTQYAGTFPGLSAVGSYAHVRSRATAQLETGPWSFGWTGRFISGARVPQADPPFDLYAKSPGLLYQDINISRRVGGLVVMAGIDNIAGTRPPTLVDGTTNTNTSTYDVIGRLFWTRISYAF